VTSNTIETTSTTGSHSMISHTPRLHTEKKNIFVQRKPRKLVLRTKPYECASEANFHFRGTRLF